MRKFVPVLFLAACAATSLLLAAPAHAQWVTDGMPTYNPNLDQTSTSGQGINTMSVSAMDVKSQASAPAFQAGQFSASCSRTYTQKFKWSGTGTSTWSTWQSQLSGGIDGSVTTTVSFMGVASSNAGGKSGASCNGPTGSYTSSLSGTVEIMPQMQGQGQVSDFGKVQDSVTYKLSASTTGSHQAADSGTYSGVGHASMSLGTCTKIN